LTQKQEGIEKPKSDLYERFPGQE